MPVNTAHIEICSRFVCFKGYPFSKIENMHYISQETSVRAKLFVVQTVESRLKAGWAS